MDGAVMGVFDDIPAWARLPQPPLAHMAAQATTQPWTPERKKPGRPKGAKDSKPRVKLPAEPQPKEPDNGDTS
jgi:hypothetical protein